MDHSAALVWEPAKSTRPPRKRHLQVVDLVRLFWYPDCHFLFSATNATMLLMPKYRWLRSGIYAMLLALALTSACSRRVALSSSDGAGQSDSRDLPFHGDTNAAASADAASHPEVPDRNTSSKAVPFKASASPILPAGTLLTVRLENTLTSANPLAGKTFLAVFEEPVTIDGRTVIPRDAEVKGRVESARVSNAKRRTGYLRLTLDSIRIGDKQIALPTSSLFARGIIDRTDDDATDDDSPTAASRARPVAAHPRVVRLNKGRPLTFRLTAAVDLSKPTDDRPQSGTK